MFKKDGNTIQSFWVGISSLSSFSLAIISAAILSRYFDKAEYGTYRQILYVYNTLLVIFAAGLPSIFPYYLPRFNKRQGKDIVWKITKVLFILGAVFSIFMFIFSDIIAVLLNNSELGRGLKYFSPIPMMLLPTLGIEGIFSVYKKTYYIAIYNTLTRAIMLFFIILPVIFLKRSYIYAIYGWIIASFITMLLAISFKEIPFKDIIREKANLSYREIFTYSIPLLTASLWGIALRSSDQFFISRYFGREVFAEFSNGFIGLPFVGVVTGATSVVLMPIFSKMIHDKSDVSNIINLWRRALIKSAIIIYPLVLFFMFNANSIIIVLYSTNYTNSVIYFQIAMILNFFNIIIFAPILLAMGETVFYSRIHMLFAIIAWIFGYLVVIIFKSPIAIAIFSVLLSIIMIFTFIRYVSKLFNVRSILLFPVKIISKLIIHSLLIISLVKILTIQLFPKLDNITLLIISFIGYAIILILTANIFNLDYLVILKPTTRYMSDSNINS